MNLILIKTFLSEYSLQTVIIAVICSAVTLICKAVLKDKLCTFVKNYLPIILATVLEVLSDVLIKHTGLNLTMDVIYAGLISGSLSLAISAILSGKKNKSILFLTISELLNGYVNPEKSEEVADAILEVFKSNSDDKTRLLQTEKLIAENSILKDKGKISMVADLINESVKALTVK